MFVHENKVELKLFRYVEVKDSSAVGIITALNRIIDACKNPLFKNYFYSNIASVATDGASNMIGKYNSFVQKLQNLTAPYREQRPLQKYHCANHLLALAYNDVMYSNQESLQYCHKMTQYCNRLAAFYASKSYKKRAALQDEAAELNEQIRSFQRIMKVRWMPSSQRSYSIIDQNFKTFVTHLKKLKLSPTKYTSEGRLEAAHLIAIFTDKNYLATLYHHLDMINELSIAAKSFERKVSSVIDMERVLEKVRDNLDVLKAVPGTFLRNFLFECSCYGYTGCTIEQLEAYNNVTFRTHILTTGGSGIPPLSQTRLPMLDEIKEALEKRFPSATVSSFSNLLPQSLSSIPNANWKEFAKHLNEYYGLPNTIETKLKSMQSHIIQSTFFQQNKNSPPEQFWSNVLQQPSLLLNDADLIKLIKIALVQPAGTAQVESGFSILGKIKNEIRSSLNIETVEKIMRIRFNGPKIEAFPRYQIASEWLKAGHHRVD